MTNHGWDVLAKSGLATLLAVWAVISIYLIIKINALAEKSKAYGDFQWQIGGLLVTFINYHDPRCPEWIEKRFRRYQRWYFGLSLACLAPLALYQVFFR